MIGIAIILSTYAISGLIRLDLVRKIIKDGTKEGLIPNLEYYRGKHTYPNRNPDLDRIFNSVPILNIAKAAVDNISYMIYRNDEYNYLVVQGAFERMDKDEEEYFNKRPTVLRALNLASKRDKKKKQIIENYRNVNYSDNIVKEIVKLNNEIDEHDIIKEKNNKKEKVSIEDLIKTMNKEELIELKETLNLFKEYDKHFDGEPDGEYIIDSNKDRMLKLEFKRRGE